MRDLTTKALLLLILLALVLNAFVMLVGPGRAADEGAQVGRYAIVPYKSDNRTEDYGYYRMDTVTGQVWWRYRIEHEKRL